MKRKVRAFPLELRAIGEDAGGEGRFTGYASVFGVEDAYGTIVDKGAFKKTIRENKGKFPLLWMHNPYLPIGMGDHKEDDHGLLVDGRLDLNTVKGGETYSGLREGYIDCMSIAFDVISTRMLDEKVHFTELRLWESSLLVRNFAANPEAVVTDVRGIEELLSRLAGQADGLEGEPLSEAIATLRSLLDELESRAQPASDDAPAPTDTTEPPSPVVLPAAPSPYASLLAETRGLVTALSSRGPAPATHGAEPHPGSEPERFHSLLAELRAFGQSISRGN
jgi:HK97 family phage prohead protease